MVRMHTHSITRRLTWLNMLVSGAALLLACVSFATYETLLLHQNMARSLSVQAQMIATNNASALIFNDPRSAEASLIAAPCAAASPCHLGVDLCRGWPAVCRLPARPGEV